MEKMTPALADRNSSPHHWTTAIRAIYRTPHDGATNNDYHLNPYHLFLSSAMPLPLALEKQSIIDTDDFQVVIASVRILCETVNEFLNRVTETHRDDEQLLIKCDILR